MVHKLVNSNIDNKINLHIWLDHETMQQMFERSNKFKKILTSVLDKETNEACDDFIFDLAQNGELDLIEKLLRPMIKEEKNG